MTTLLRRWHDLSRRGKALVVSVVVVTVVCAVASVVYVLTGDGLSIENPENPQLSYLWVFLLVALDGVIPIFPGRRRSTPRPPWPPKASWTSAPSS